MAIWLDNPPLDSTQKLVYAVLEPILTTAKHIQFLAPAGEGDSIAQRMRVMISRKRKKLDAKGGKPKRFMLRSDIYNYTERGTGKRFDCVVMWVEMRGTDHMTQDLEDLLQ